MCGIAGVLDDGSTERDALVEQMTERLRHRGPDEAGFHHDGHVALGMRRLSIQDVSHGHQPAFDESQRVACVLNGEIYNVAELQELLRARGHQLASNSDTDCLPHLYEEFGLDFVDHLRGMFALALWDADRHRLVLARDRLGKKPLYYRDEGSRLSFASELKALLIDSSLGRRADPVALSHYLTLQYVPAPWSAVEGVRKLPPGHMLVAEGRDVYTHGYWSPAYAPEGRDDPRSDEELVEELREQLLDAVRVRLVGERPMGAFLSGGLDSSAVVAAMSQVSDQQVRTFSIGFEDAAFDELPHARRIAERFGTEHHELVVRPEALDLVPRVATMFDEPYADSSAIPSWYLADMASRSVVVALNGDGGDEVLAGYTRYHDFLTRMGRSLPPALARPALGAGTWLRQHGPGSLGKVGSGLILYGESDPARRYARQMSYFRPEEKDQLFTPEFAREVAGHDTYELVQRAWRDHESTDPVNRLLAVDTHTYLPGDLLPKVDITTMSVSLEARSPFLDQRLVEWAAGVPGPRKLPGGNLKALLKGVLEDWIPYDLLHRRKQGFAVPLDDWLRGPLRPLVHDVLLDRTAEERGILRPEAVRRLVEAHQAGADRGTQVYALLMLELWFREVLEA